MGWGQDPDDHDRDPAAWDDDSSPTWPERPAGTDTDAPGGTPTPPTAGNAGPEPPAWGDAPARVPDEGTRRAPGLRRNPQLGRDPQWGREPRRDNLRPLDLGDVLDGMFRIAGRHWQVFALGLGVVVVPMALLSGLVFAQFSGSTPGLLEQFQNPELIGAVNGVNDAEQLARLAGASMLSGLASILLTPLVYGIAVQVAATGYRGGEVDAMDSVRAAARRYPALLGSTLLVWVTVGAIAFGPVLLVGVSLAIVGADGATAAVLAVLVLLATVVIAIIASIRLSLVVPAVVIEHAGAATALRRSNELVRGRTGMVLGTLLVAVIIVSIIGFILTLPFQVPGVLLGATAGAVITTAGSIVTSLVTNSLLGVAFVLLYFDRRVRVEGYDLTELASELGDDAGARW